MKLSLLLFLVLPTAVADSSVTSRLAAACDLDQPTPIYHQDSVCDRAAMNEYRRRLGRGGRVNWLKPMGVSLVPNTKTLICPEEVQPLVHQHSLVGLDTKWIVENTASTPVVLAYVQNGVEYSAFNPTVTPPQRDPLAILQPGQWSSVNTYEGHVFHARELRPDGSLGDVLLQHRVGLHAIRNVGGMEFACDPTADPEPLVNTTSKPERAPGFRRTTPDQNRRCNALDVGFRNEVGCPIHLYWLGARGEGEEQHCQEIFKFHLGTNLKPDDFMWSWDSATKFEGSYVGHTFVARLAQDPSVLLDTITLAPTVIGDCPGLKQKNYVTSGGNAVVLPTGVLEDIGQNVNGTTAANVTSTLPSQAFPIASLLSL